MQDVKISQLPIASSVAAADQSPIVQGGTTKQVTAGIAKNAKGIYSGAGAPGLSAPNGSLYLRTDGTSDTTLYIRSAGAWSSVSAAASVVVVPPIPQLASWESKMTTFGAQHDDQTIIANSINASYLHAQVDESTVWYYDGALVYQQIANYTGDPSWFNGSTYCRSPYLNWLDSWGAPLAPNANLVGNEIFPHGLLNDWLLTGNTRSRNGVLECAKSGAFSGVGGGSGVTRARDTAYCINSYVAADYAGYGTAFPLAQSIAWAKGHVDKWFISKTWASEDPSTGLQPFIVALTCESFINYYGKYGDATVVPLLKTCVDGLWGDGWYLGNGLFKQSAVDSNDGYITNFLLSITLGFLWQAGYGDLYWQRFDELFSLGIQNVSLSGGQQFSQVYRNSFDGVRLRGSALGDVTLYPYRYQNAGIPGPTPAAYDVGAYQT